MTQSTTTTDSNNIPGSSFRYHLPESKNRVQTFGGLGFLKRVQVFWPFFEYPVFLFKITESLLVLNRDQRLSKESERPDRVGLDKYWPVLVDSWIPFSHLSATWHCILFAFGTKKSKTQVLQLSDHQVENAPLRQNMDILVRWCSYRKCKSNTMINTSGYKCNHVLVMELFYPPSPQCFVITNSQLEQLTEREQIVLCLECIVLQVVANILMSGKTMWQSKVNQWHSWQLPTHSHKLWTTPTQCSHITDIIRILSIWSDSTNSIWQSS